MILRSAAFPKGAGRRSLLGRCAGCRSAAALLLVLGLSTCGDSTGPPPVALIELLDGLLSAEVATSLSFSVRIDEASGIPIEGTPIVFSPSLGSGTVLPTTLTTGATGQVMVTWTLGETAGTQSVRVSAGEKSIVVEASATPGAPEAVVSFSGDTQIGVVGAQLDAPVVVQVQDRFGNGVPGVLVIFEPVTGSVSATHVTSDEAGNAQTGWTLGEHMGPQSLTATSDADAVTFSATAEPGPPSSVTVVSGDEQTGQVGMALQEPLVLDVRDEFANAATGATVTLSGDGSADPTNQTVDADGRISARWTLGTVSGPQVLTVAAGVASVDMQAVAVPGPPSLVEAVSGTAQQSYATATLTDPIVARVLDEFGNVVPGGDVSFVVTEGGGTVVPLTVRSDADGRAQSVWTLGVVIGGHALEARVEGADSGLFTAEAVSGPPAQLVSPSGNAQTAVVAATLPDAIVFEVLDVFGTPVPGALVTMTVSGGGGSLEPDSAATSTTGRVSTVWTLGTTAGPQAVEASVPGVSVPTTVSATALAGPPTEIVANSGDGQTPVVETSVAVAPSVRVSDAFGNPVAGVSVSFVVVAGGGSATGTAQATNALGIATVGSWTVGSAVGLNTLSAMTSGIGSVTFSATSVLTPVFDIYLRFVGTPPTASQRVAFDAASSRWAQLVTADLTDVSLVVAAGGCGGLGHPAIDEIVDDVLIFAQVDSIDGPGGILGSAGPCFVRAANGLSIAGSMRFDVDDVDELEASGNLGDVILHEMGHVLGIGTLSGWYDILQDRGGPDPFFPGAAAVSHYTTAGGTAQSPVPVANTGGGGTRDAHWREANMGAELMTGFLASGMPNPLSAITVGALQDLGYVVNHSAADAYNVSSGLRLEADELIQLIEMAPPPPLVIDEHGRVIPIRR